MRAGSSMRRRLENIERRMLYTKAWFRAVDEFRERHQGDRNLDRLMLAEFGVTDQDIITALEDEIRRRGLDVRELTPAEIEEARRDHESIKY